MQVASADEPEEPETEEPIATRPFVPCVPVTDCGIVARHRLASRFARTRGFYESPSGQVASRHVQWETPGRAEGTFFIEVTDSCWVEGGYYIESEGQIWLLDANEELLPIEVEHNARRFAPVGHSFFDDGTHIFDRWEILDDEDVDRTTFHACTAVPEDPTVSTFYPAAEDSHGLFGHGDCGDLGRATL